VSENSTRSRKSPPLTWIAGIEPFQRINGQDQKAFILSVNVNRRHMTAAQRAMSTAMIYPSAPRGRGKKDDALKGDAPSSFSRRRLQYARAVLARSPPIAQAVLSGSKSLDEAYSEVQIATGKINNDTIWLRKLRDCRPDFADGRALGGQSLRSRWSCRHQRRHHHHARAGRQRVCLTNIGRPSNRVYSIIWLPRRIARVTSG
jgi:hypothetical protein